MLQNLGSQMAVRVASLIQQHAALSLENNTLKQQLLRTKQEKFIVDSKYIMMISEIYVNLDKKSFIPFHVL